jgi:predicted metal-dependent phosphoesterase TrpH
VVTAKRYSFDKVFKNEPAWYSGDFHAHTSASSDGDYPPNVLAELARVEGLDFVSITDHNTIEGLSELDSHLEYPIVPGIEITLNNGHFNVFGIGESHQWIEDIGDSSKEVQLPSRYSSVSELMETTARQGLLNSINHPLLHPWDWSYSNTDLRFVHCIELWNDLYWPGNVFANPKTVELWTKWLNAGYRITAIGGSDYHYPPKPDQGLPGERLGQPTTYVYAEDLSIPAILEGLRQGRVYVSKGPKVNFQAQLDGISYGIGDDLGEQSGNLEISVTIENGPEKIYTQLVRNGESIAITHSDGPQSGIEFHEQVDPAQPAWFRIEIMDKHWEVLTITNPIFQNIQGMVIQSSLGPNLCKLARCDSANKSITSSYSSFMKRYMKNPH